jgi:hypothetical protein
MAKAYYSTVFEQKAADVRKIVRDFNNYLVSVGGAGEGGIEDGRVRRQRRRGAQRAPSGTAHPTAAVGAI